MKRIKDQLSILKENWKKIEETKKVSLTNIILSCFDKLNKSKYKSVLGGGNCGQVAYAICKYITDKYPQFKDDIGIGFITDSDVSDDDLGNKEINIYHMYVIDTNTSILYDETGTIDDNYLGKLALNQYDKSEIKKIEPFYIDEELIGKIIRNDTNWSVDWQQFYSIIK